MRKLAKMIVLGGPKKPPKKSRSSQGNFKLDSRSWRIGEAISFQLAFSSPGQHCHWQQPEVRVMGSHLIYQPCLSIPEIQIYEDVIIEVDSTSSLFLWRPSFVNWLSNHCVIRTINLTATCTQGSSRKP
jgi:hypothetical protein